MKRKIQVLRPIALSSYQFFLQWFSKACEAAGMEGIFNINIPWKVRQLIAKLRLSRKLMDLSSDILIVPCGGYPDSFCFPYGYSHEIVPVIWDAWPRYHDRLISSFKRHKIKLAFFTQRQVAEIVHNCLPAVCCIWLPEGIEVGFYSKGGPLKGRQIDLLELGRLMPNFHNSVKQLPIVHKYKDPSYGLLFDDFDALRDGLAASKITVCFPRCDTHPEEAGNIETLTQRYWECMLSRTLMIGRCPKELRDFIGYDPVIPVEWENCSMQVVELLNSIEKYQAFVDHNYEVAIAKAPWINRMATIKDAIKDIYGTT